MSASDRGAAGPVFEDDYEILGELGRGGFGTVLEARQRRSGARVAAKVAHPDLADSLRDRIAREARLLARVDHPRLARLLGCLRDRTGAPVLIYQFVSGESLDRVLGDGPPEPATALAWIADVAEGIDALHAAGLVHRDLKPGNLILEPGGRIRLLDFGLARPDLPGSTLTAAGAVVGTPGYMAPEQLTDGASTREVDRYALGALAYTLLSGRPPYRGDLPTIVTAQHAGPPAPVSGERPGLSRRLDPVLERMLALDPTRRFPSGEAFRAALREACEPRGATPGETRRLAPVEVAATTLEGASLPGEATGRFGPAPQAGPPGSIAKALLPAFLTLVVVALGLARRGETLAPETSSTGAGLPRGAALGLLASARSRLATDPDVERFSRTTDAVETSEADLRWKAARRVFRNQVAPLAEAVARLADGPAAIEAFDDAAALVALQGFLVRTGSGTYRRHGELFPEDSPDPRLVRLVEPFVKVAPVRTMGGTIAFPLTAWIEKGRAELPGGRRHWAVVRDRDQVSAAAVAEGRTTGYHALLPMNPAGTPFTDPVNRLGDGGSLVSAMMGQRGSYATAPSRIAWQPVGFEGDLELVLLGSDFHEKFQYRLEVSGGGRVRTIPFYAPRTIGEAVEIHPPRLALAVSISRRLLPFPLETVGLTVRAVQPLGSPLWVSHVEEIYQRVGKESPEALGALFRTAAEPILGLPAEAADGEGTRPEIR